jgi:hypothetical protein
MAAGWVSWPLAGPTDHRGAGSIVVPRRHRHARRMWCVRPGWLSGPLLGCTGRDPLCPASRRQREIEDNPQRPHAACTVAPPNGLRAEGDVGCSKGRRLHCTYSCMHGGVSDACVFQTNVFLLQICYFFIGGKLRVGKIGILLCIDMRGIYRTAKGSSTLMVSQSAGTSFPTLGHYSICVRSASIDIVRCTRDLYVHSSNTPNRACMHMVRYDCSLA